MTITAPITTEPQHDDIVVIADDVHTSRHFVDEATMSGRTVARRSDPLVPFLALGVLSWLTIIVTASILAL